MKQKILVLGRTGMLGGIVLDYLSKNEKFQVVGTSRKRVVSGLNFDAEKFLFTPKKYDYIRDFDYIVNCIGVIKPFCRDDDSVGIRNAVAVNAFFPHQLNNFLKGSKTKIIQIATDCVFTGRVGKYKEDSPHDALDVYGKTKSLGEAFEGNFLNIRCSIIGFEKNTKNSLLEWFLMQEEGAKLKGFSHHSWNGVTTLQFAKLVEKIIEEKLFAKLILTSHIHHFVPNHTVDKFQLLEIFKRVFKRKVEIEEVNNIGPKIDRTLATKYKSLEKTFGTSSIRKALEEIRDYPY